MFEIAEDMESSLKSNRPENLRIHLGVSDEIDRPFVVEVVSKLARMHSKVPPLVTMTSDAHQHLLARLKTNSLDAVITNQSSSDEGMAPLSAIRMPVVLAFRKSDEYRAIKKLKNWSEPSTLAGLKANWVLPHPKMRLRSEIDAFMEKKKVGGRTVFESDVLASVVRAVTDGMGIGFLPLPYIMTEVAQGKLEVRGPKGGFWEHGVWLLSTRKHQDDVMLQALKTSFERTASGTGAARLK